MRYILENKKPTIITISGAAGSGKDTFGAMLSESLTKQGARVLVTHYADLLKYILKSFFNWDGKKDEYGRHLLQYVGTDVVRKANENYWVDFVKSMVELFGDHWDYVIIPDARFENEIDRFIIEYNVISIIVKREFETQLSEDAQLHISENALDGYQFDIEVTNRTLEQLEESAELIAEYAARPSSAVVKNSMLPRDVDTV